jgi:hypothetical protein
VKTVRANASPWIFGTLLALLGVALARLVAPTLTGHTRLVVTIGGQLLGLAGLFVICLGVRRRLRAAGS